MKDILTASCRAGGMRVNIRFILPPERSTRTPSPAGITFREGRMSRKTSDRSLRLTVCKPGPVEEEEKGRGRAEF